MIWSVLETGPYAERLWDSGFLTRDPDGTFVFSLPLGPTGAMPLIPLDDIAEYAKWIFEHPERSAGLQLGVGFAHVNRG